MAEAQFDEIRRQTCRAVGYLFAATFIGLVTWGLFERTHPGVAVLGFLLALVVGLWIVRHFCEVTESVFDRHSAWTHAGAPVEAPVASPPVPTPPVPFEPVPMPFRRVVFVPADDLGALVDDAMRGQPLPFLAPILGALAPAPAPAASRPSPAAPAPAASPVPVAPTPVVPVPTPPVPTPPTGFEPKPMPVRNTVFVANDPILAPKPAPAAPAAPSPGTAPAPAPAGAAHWSAGVGPSGVAAPAPESFTVRSGTILAGEEAIASEKGSWTYAAPAAEGPATVEAVRPAALTAPRSGTGDDLKLIKGVGPKLEALLHSLGFFHFDQIASWSASEIAWVDQNLEGFKGRVTRDEWVAQAKILLAGGSVEDFEIGKGR